MDDWTKVLLYGTYDGFTRSTDGLHRIVVVLEGGERVEIPKEFVVSADQMVNKNKIKLKDVVARIKSFDVDAREAWLNEILNGLGSDFGSKKYRDGYEQGKLEGLIEREKVEVPQIIADYIKYAKTTEWDLQEAMKNVSYEDNAEFRKWFYKGSNVEVFARAWLDGYTVEKEKRYLVKIIGITNYNSYLNYHKGENKWTIESCVETDVISTKHTRKELEEAGFGEVFNSPLFEVEEVE